MAVSQISSLSSTIQTVVGKIIATAQNEVVMRQLVTTLVWPDHKGHPVQLPKLGALSNAAGLTEGVDLANPQTLSDSAVTITPAEVGLMVVVTDRMLNRAPPGFDMMVAEEMSSRYALKMDTDLLGLFSGLNNGLAAPGTALNVGNVGAGRAVVRGNPTEPGKGPLYLVVHPYHAWDIQAALLPLSGGTIAAGSTDAISPEVLRNAALGRLFGASVFEDGNISVDGNDDAYSAIFAKEAFVLMVTSEGEMEEQRDASLRGTELVFVGEYGYGERTGTAGYYLQNDAATPTS